MEEENNRLKGAKREEMCDRSQEGASTTFGAEKAFTVAEAPKTIAVG